jgi:hypothetical protein
MSTYKKKSSFSSDDEIAEVKQTLQRMVEDTTYNTQSGFSPNTTLYPDNIKPFIDKHMDYLMSHKGLDPQQYLANLRLITRTR